MSEEKKPLWSGRFGTPIDPRVLRFTSSLQQDKRIAASDVRGSIAHARMLGRQKILSEAERAKIVGGLERIAREIEEGRFPWSAEVEDIHTAIELRLAELVGDVAGKLHTARSRNDQIALDLRLFTIDRLNELDAAILELARALIDRARDETETIMPGYTHLQRAQPVSLAHHLLAHVEALRRDRARIAEARERAATSPLGAGALAGVPYATDPVSTARDLGLERVFRNSVDAVADRDFVVDFVYVAALAVLAATLGGVRFDRAAMRRATDRGMLGATDLADHLAKRGVPFREAHEIVGRIVQERLAAGRDLDGLTLEDLRRHDKRFEGSALDEIKPERSLAARTSPGGTAPVRVREALAEAEAALR